MNDILKGILFITRLSGSPAFMKILWMYFKSSSEDYPQYLKQILQCERREKMWN